MSLINIIKILAKVIAENINLCIDKRLAPYTLDHRLASTAAHLEITNQCITKGSEAISLLQKIISLETM